MRVHTTHHHAPYTTSRRRISFGHQELIGTNNTVSPSISMVYTTQELPKEARIFKASETKKYRDCVCEIFNLHFKQIAGAGNCFFESVATLLPLVPGRGGVHLHHTVLRSVAIKWLKDCATRPGFVYEQCMEHMRAELQHPIGKQTPADIHEYLEMSAKDGVWVAGSTPLHHHHQHTPPPYTTTTSIHHHTPHTPPYTTSIHR